MNLRSFSTLQIALGVSIALHAVLLTIRFVDPESFNRVFQDTPLDVILVNAKSDEKVDRKQAKAIAQYALLGGGDVEKGRATSPLPPSPTTATGDATEDAQRRVEALQEQQSTLLAQVRQQLAALPPPDPRKAAKSAEAQAVEERRRQLTNLLAEIERRINEENARPKRRYVSPATAAGVHALYYTRFKERVEQLGTQNFPTIAGNKLYGELTMVITLNSHGEVISTEIVQSSGNRTLDRLAQTIVKAGAPYGAFTPAMLREFQVMVVPSRFRFTREETLETQSTNASTNANPISGAAGSQAAPAMPAAAAVPALPAPATAPAAAAAN